MAPHFEEWRAIRMYGEGLQPRTGRHWNCVPAWDVTALYAGPDGELPHPDYYRALAGEPGEHPNRDKKTGVFWDRHIDRRFHIEYPLASKDSPRVQGRTIGDTDREWDALIEYRDRCLREAGLTLSSPPAVVAKALAESFLYDKFQKRPQCATFLEEPRQLNNPIEGLLHTSHCVGCALACAALADSCGLAARTIGCGAHRVTEVLLEGGWRHIENSGRHGPGLGAFFLKNYHDMYLDPMGDHGAEMPESYRDGLYRRPNPQFHFPLGMWDSPWTLRWSASCAYALYPENRRWGFKSAGGARLPILARSGGFYWPSVHGPSDAKALAQVHAAGLPHRMAEEGPSRGYFYHPFRPGEKLRQSVWLDALDDLVEMELVFPFGASWATDFSERVGKQLVLRIGDLRRSLSDLGAWPPAGADPDTIARPSKGDNLVCTVKLPRDAFRPNAVNWVELHQGSATLLYVPCLPEMLEPYLAPLWTETEDACRPPQTAAARRLSGEGCAPPKPEGAGG